MLLPLASSSSARCRCPAWRKRGVSAANHSITMTLFSRVSELQLNHIYVMSSLNPLIKERQERVFFTLRIAGKKVICIYIIYKDAIDA